MSLWQEKFYLKCPNTKHDVLCSELPFNLFILARLVILRSTQLTCTNISG